MRRVDGVLWLDGFMGKDALELPPGVKLVRTLEHDDVVGRIAWSPDGRMLAAPVKNKLRLWNWRAGSFRETGTGTSGIAVKFDRTSNLIAVCGDGAEIFDPNSGKDFNLNECFRLMVNTK
ncbi:MAG TPA: hypothetical protein VEX68_05105 [Bryobacteraceae bacterium]|nr:hypothetical protein [Bryobacteraceae bacterium]